MDAFDVFDIHELLDVIDWWGTGASQSPAEYASLPEVPALLETSGQPALARDATNG
ncbi:hypothetical protein K0T92_10280 [Paenibacillus oenotherae]|uniref:Uncharacterized protein n=1 Tax=Paenibacillus oenotherae TaxID=1435645 RepID=A0ABS7D5L1_9BACL|nr:hypothetical protein [Paenibacillus oenotherae]MBW7475134.1 hypothetical protein [Paenibacillus oenotherae]